MQGIQSRAMVLQNDDLLRRILAELEPSSSARQGHLTKLHRKSLLNVALACRVFREPALDTLWRSLESFHPLVGLLSLSSRTEIGSNDCTASKESHEQLVLLRKYGKRVRRIVLDACVHPMPTIAGPLLSGPS